MIRISRKLLSCILGALACVALVFGVLMSRPQTKVASAETAVTFSSVTLDKEVHATYGTSIRINTSALAWETYHSWVAASDWTSIADYTTVNGRTVTEINNDTTHTQKITLMMQPAGSFSFLRLYIPDEILAIDDINTMGIKEGWSFDNGVATFTASAVTYYRNGGSMANMNTLTANTTLTADQIEITKAELVNPTYPARFVDSYSVYINIGQEITTEYNTMYDGYKTIRNAIYINGKSIEKWNEEKIAEDTRFADPSSYTSFPQNSTDPSHLTPFVKPIGLWATSTGFRLSIFQELVADCEKVVVTVGESCRFNDVFIVTEAKSLTVLEQEVVNITNKLAFLDNTINANFNNTTNTYYINTGNEACWTKSPFGGCLNEGDPAAVGGGQIQMKYITFNGSTLWDINKNDNGSYGSAQGNIASGGVYAPILATMSSELGSSLKLMVPTTYTNGKSGHEEIIIKKGFNVAENGVSYYVTNDIIFTNTGNGWTKEIKPIEVATEVTGIVTKANRTDGGNNENFVIFQLSNNDYAGLNTAAITDISSLYGYINIGGTVIDSYSGEKFFNVWKIANSVAFRFGDVATLQQVPYITIKAGAKFPSYTTQNGGALTYFVTQEDVTFIHDVPNDTWTVGELPEEPTETLIDTSITDASVGSGYVTLTLSECDYANAGATTLVDGALNGLLEKFAYTDSSKTTTATSLTSITVTGNTIQFQVDGLGTRQLQGWKSITIKAGAKFPSATATGTKFYVTKEDVTYYKEDGTWTATKDVTSELTFVHQTQQFAGTETYMIRTQKAYWTKAPKGGCLNEHDYLGASPAGGQEQMQYLYFNGTSLYDINKGDDGSYNSEQGNIASGGIYAPILVTMGLEGTSYYSYIQIHVPTEYPNVGATANENHQSIEIKAGFSVTTAGGNTYKVTQDIKWINLNGTWVNAANTFDASTVTISNPRRDGAANELYKIDIVSDSWLITCNNYDFMYDNADTFNKYRQKIFINGVSVYDINANTDDSAYVYSTSPSKDAGDIFAVPVLIETYTGNYNQVTIPEGAAPTNKITLWIHEEYMKTLGDEIIITLGAGYNAYTTDGKYLLENVDYDMVAEVIIDDTMQSSMHKVIKGDCVAMPSTPDKPMTDTAIYTFENWYISDTDTVFDFSTPVTEDLTIVARYTETEIVLEETEVKEVLHFANETTDPNGEPVTDRWLVFYLTNHDYIDALSTHNIKSSYDMLVNWGTLDKIILKGEMTIGNEGKESATLREVLDTNTEWEAIFMNIWNSDENNYAYSGTIAFRIPGVTSIDEIVIEDGCFFPSYSYIIGETTDKRYAIMQPQTFKSTTGTGTGTLIPSTFDYDIQMEDGASVRIKDIDKDFEGTATDTAAYNTSGIRFETKIAIDDIEKLLAKLQSGEYTNVSFGTLIATTSDLMGGQFTHEWLDASGVQFKNIVSTAGFYQVDGEWTYTFPDGDENYQSFYGSIVKLKTANYTRWFSGLGYMKITTANGETIYVYAEYNPANSRSIAHVASAAISDRESEYSENKYQYEIGEGSGSWSRYTTGVNKFLAVYLNNMNIIEDDKSLTDSGLQPIKLDALSSPVADTINPTVQATVNVGTKLAGSYVVLRYTTNVNVRGRFYYRSNSNTSAELCVEDFYLQAGTTEHKQFLDIYRYNGVGNGLTSTDLYMDKIEFWNAELKNSITGNVKINAFYSVDKSLVKNSQIYLTVVNNGVSTTVGANLGLGGALTYLARSGIYEGVKGQEKNSSFSTSFLGYTKYKYNTGNVVLQTTTDGFDESHATGNKTTEAAYYGHATSSEEADGAVNLINNSDAGRQIQQAWYANVGGTAADTKEEMEKNESWYNSTEGIPGYGANGYNRALCKTATVNGYYWPYNPVQAGDNQSNPSQIIDYELNTEKGYIYVKTRAMDWGKGRLHGALPGTVEGGETTKSYMENYYRLKEDGTLYVNNSFIDWNGFTDMELCDFHSLELPAVYPVHTLNWYVTNETSNAWKDDLTYRDNLISWGADGHYYQDINGTNKTDTWKTSEGTGPKKVEDWFAWANDENGTFALGMYIPNVAQFTSGRQTTSTGLSIDFNRNALESFALGDYNMYKNDLTYRSAYVSNTSYTAPGINVRMEAYKSMEYTYVIALGSVDSIREKFHTIAQNGTVTNAGQPGRYEKVGLDAWARTDKRWTW